MSRTHAAVLTELYRGYAHTVLRRAERILGTRAEAEDVLHDLFVRWHERPEELERMREPAAFVYGATTHACLNRCATRRRARASCNEKCRASRRGPRARRTCS